MRQLIHDVREDGPKCLSREGFKIISAVNSCMEIMESLTNMVKTFAGKLSSFCESRVKDLPSFRSRLYQV